LGGNGTIARDRSACWLAGDGGDVRRDTGGTRGRSRVDSYDWPVSLVIMPVGFAVVGPLSASAGFSATLVAAALVAAVPCALAVLIPGIRGVRRTPDGEIVGPSATDPVPAGSAT
jgi:hypothetical protein